MNDFTKEELIYLHNQLEFDFLKEKIKSMIENYEKPEYCDVSGIKLGLTVDDYICPKCSAPLADNSAVFWSEDMSNVKETISYCSNRFCDYKRVTKND